MPDESELVMSPATHEAIVRFVDGAIEGVPSGAQAITALVGLMRDNRHIFDYTFRLERVAATKRAA